MFMIPVSCHGGVCKYRDKFIYYIDRVSTCNAIDTVSCDCGVITQGLFCKWFGKVFFGGHILSICTQMKVG